VPCSMQLDKERNATSTPECQTGVRVVRRHNLLVRCSHWLNVPILLGLILSGVSIYWASPVYQHKPDPLTGNVDPLADIGRIQRTLNLRIGTRRGAMVGLQKLCDRPVPYVIEGPRKIKKDPALPSYLSPARPDRRCKAATWVARDFNERSTQFLVRGSLLTLSGCGANAKHRYHPG
jgi:hypothetical protein